MAQTTPTKIVVTNAGDPLTARSHTYEGAESWEVDTDGYLGILKAQKLVATHAPSTWSHVRSVEEKA